MMSCLTAAVVEVSSEPLGHTLFIHSMYCMSLLQAQKM